MVDWLGRHGIDEVIMACGFKAEALRSALGDAVPGGPVIRYIQEDEPLGTAGPGPARGRHGTARRSLHGPQRRRPHRSRPHRAAAPARRDRRRDHARAVSGRRPDLLRARAPGGRRRGPRLPREARPGGDRHRRGQRGRLRDRAPGARPDPRGPGRLDRARGVSAGGRPGPLRPPPRGLLDGHRDPAALPAGELGHPRRHRRDRASRRRRAVHRRRHPDRQTTRRSTAGPSCGPAAASAVARRWRSRCCSTTA